MAAPQAIWSRKYKIINWDNSTDQILYLLSNDHEFEFFYDYWKFI